MNLLFKRHQVRKTWGHRFQLWARFELTHEESQLIATYDAYGAILSLGDPPRDLKRSAWRGAAGGLVALWLANAYFGLGPFAAVLVGLLAFAGLTFLVYQQIREEIRVRDILNGRYFSCKSVLTLVEKERTLTEMAVLFRRFLETMKTWGGEEVIAIDHEPRPALRLEPPQHAAA